MAHLQKYLAKITLSICLTAVVLTSLPVACASGPSNSGVAQHHQRVNSFQQVAMVLESRFPQHNKALNDEQAQTGPVTVRTNQPETLPESGAATSLWPILIALIIVALYLAHDTYRRKLMSK